MHLPRKQLHIISGASGSGKTTLILQALKHWEMREPFPFEIDASSVGYLVADRGEGDVKDLAKDLGLKNVEIYGFVGDKTFPLSYLKDAELMLQKCLERFVKKHDFIILDPLLPFMKEKNTKDLTATMLSLIPLTRMADSENITILGSHHSSKTRTDFQFLRAQDRSSGSAGMQGYSCVQLALVEGVEMNTPLHMLEITPHREARQTFYFERGESGWFRVVENKRGRLGKYREAFDDDELPAKELIEFAKEVGVSKSTLYREIDEMVKRGILQREKGVYKIPKK
jgi:RecA-family ATPase